MIALMYMDGSALSWYQWMHMNNQLFTWSQFKESLNKIFGPSSYRDLKDEDLQRNITRFTLLICSLAFNSSDSLLAAAHDDDDIKLIVIVDSLISRVLKGHNGPITGLAFDLKNEILASIDEFETVKYWELSFGKPIHTLKSVAPNCDSDASQLNLLCWNPDGEILVVPGLKNAIVMYDRDTAENLFTLKEDHKSLFAL